MLEGSLKSLHHPATPLAQTPPVLSPRSPRGSQSEEPDAFQTSGKYVKLPPAEHGIGLSVVEEAQRQDSEEALPMYSRKSTRSKISEIRKRIERAQKSVGDEAEDDDQSSYDSNSVQDASELRPSQSEFSQQSELSIHHLDQKIDCLIDLVLENLKFTKAVHMSTKKSLTGPGHECAPVLSPHKRRSVVRFVDSDDHGERNKFVGVAAMTKLVRMATPRDGMANGARHKVGRSLQEDNSETKDMLQLTRMIVRKTHAEGRIMGSSLWRFLEDRSSSIWALAYSYGSDALVCASVLLSVLEVIEMTKGNYVQPVVMSMQCIIEFLFSVEIILRFMVYPHRRAFWLNFFNTLDAVSAIPLILRVVSEANRRADKYKFGESVEYVSALCLVPVLRLMKLLRRFETFHLLLSAFRASIEAMPVILFTLLLIALFFSAIIFYCEPRHNVPTFLDSFWFVMVTICGVAHGSPAPVNISGKIWTVVMMLAGILYMAIPIGIVGSAFSAIWEERHRLLLLMRMRNCVERSGYTPAELKEMFKLLDKDSDGSLDYKEFAAMIDVMQIGVEERFVMEVFESFDADGEGSIDFRELLRGLFPRTHWLINAQHGGTTDELDMDAVCSIEEVDHSSKRDSSSKSSS